MGVKILGEDGALLHEFRDGLGAPLLYRILTVAKFTGEDQVEIILNPHVADLHTAIADSLPPARGPHTATADTDRMALGLRMRIAGRLRAAVLAGQHEWPRWSADKKTEYVTGVLFAPFHVSDQFVWDFIEEEDHYFACARRALG